jgi:hypothetical protein
MTRTRSLVSIVAVASALVGVGACNFMAGVKNDPTGTGAAGSGGAAGSDAGAMTGYAGAPTDGSPFDFGMQFVNTGSGGSGPCMNLTCQQSTCRGAGCSVKCPLGERTTVSGTIFDPAGQTALYNITVYVPNADLDPIKDGPSCDPCDPNTGTSLLSGKPVVFTKTGTDGKFILGKTTQVDVPAGTNIPMVIQVGKWQRKVLIPEVKACQDNPITDMALLHLPRNQSEGHIPKMALTTGGSDAMECLLRKIGIDDTEFTHETGMGRVNFYAGGGGTSVFSSTVGGGMMFTPANPWWDSVDNLKKYDIVLHSCEGMQGQYDVGVEPTSVKSMQARQALNDYADAGGRVFASHWHDYWFERGTPRFQSIATFNHRAGLGRNYNATIDTTFDTGMALSQWMMSVQGSTVAGSVIIDQDASARLIDAAAGGLISQRWIYADTLTPKSVLFLSATTPIPATPAGPAGTCGRVVLSDLHVSAGGAGSDSPNMPFPTGCTTMGLSPREKVLEFMLFDIASCVAPPVDRTSP